MKKILCFWCDNEVEKDGQLCPSCQKRYDQTQKEYEQIDKEYKELFGGMDCKGMIEFVKNKDKKIKELEKSNKKLKDYYWDEVNKLDESYNKDLEERIEEIEDLRNALRLACETFCSGSHPEIRLEIQNYALVSGVMEYFIQKAKEKS